jgi:hypothetical protein
MPPWLRSLALLVGLPLAGAAQSTGGTVYHARGFFLGLGLSGTSIQSNEGDGAKDSGGGGSLYLGWGFTPQLALYLEGATSGMNGDGGPYVLTHSELGLRYHFSGASRRLVPFLEGALGARMATGEQVTIGTRTDEMEVSGSAFTVGGGFLWFVSPRAGLNASLKLSPGEFTTVKFGNVTVEGFDYEATSTRLTIGVTWFTGKR